MLLLVLLLDTCASSGIVAGAQCGRAATPVVRLFTRPRGQSEETTLTTKHSSINTVGEFDFSRGLEVCGITSLTAMKSQTEAAEAFNTGVSR
ncbi:hypothetical protein VZT92_016241 [Zoarces viviparus]|uniref:Secreted protein n=1 Tax=Zoarces viviparus TaxID=48416 RepID=A0AAW1ETL5_ZOAVI